MVSSFSPEITHVIEGNSLSIKVLAAVVTGRWVVSPQWLVDSAAQGRFLNESRYGTKSLNPIRDKKFFFDESFATNDKRKRTIADLIITRLGKGHIIEDSSSADFIIVGSSQNTSELSDHSYTWDEFVIWLLDQRFLPPKK